MKGLLIGKSKAAQGLAKTIQRLGTTGKDILIIGEPGVGKGTIAKSIVETGSANAEPAGFISLNLSAINEKEFGKIIADIQQGNHPSVKKHSPAERHRIGTMVIEQVDKSGFLSQMRLVKFIEQRKSKGAGTPKKSPGALRVIVTMNDDPDLLVLKRKLLEELRNTFIKFETVVVPPLRERSEDIPLFALHFKDTLCNDLGLQDVVIDSNSFDILRHQPWHENIRELKTVIDRSILYTRDGRFTLPPELVDEKTEVMKMLDHITSGKEFVLLHSLDIVERGIIERTLEKFGFNQSRAAAFMGMTEQTLRYKLKRLGIPTSRQRKP
jgi:two-component system, NtrC family, response regulator